MHVQDVQSISCVLALTQPSVLLLRPAVIVGMLAGAASTRTHFIHHIDARLNRALYFTWWDR